MRLPSSFKLLNHRVWALSNIHRKNIINAFDYGDWMMIMRMTMILMTIFIFYRSQQSRLSISFILLCFVGWFTHNILIYRTAHCLPRPKYKCWFYWLDYVASKDILSRSQSRFDRPVCRCNCHTYIHKILKWCVREHDFSFHLRFIPWHRFCVNMALFSAKEKIDTA